MSLNKGDTIGVVALSGAVDKEKVERGKAFLEALGYKVQLSKNIYDKKRYLAGTDGGKLEELYKFFKNPEIKLILNARGGYGAIRLLNKIDYNVIKENPKPFCGYSDITALLLMFYKNSGLIGYHSPMLSGDFGVEGEVNKYTLENFFKAINDERLEYSGNKLYRSGTAEGVIWGGNLATVVSLCGLDFVPNENFIFFAEDLNEPVYKIDKMFQQLINIDKFRQNCKGIVLGDFIDVDNQKWLEEYFKELADELEIPVVGGFRITHEKDKITIPIGGKCTLEGCKLVMG